MRELPEVIQDISERVSRDVALDLMRAFGGRRVYIRRDPDGSDTLSMAVGLDAARRLSGALGAGYLYVPKNTLEETAARAARDAEIRRRRDDGWAVNSLCQHYDLSETQLYTILRSTTAP